MDRLLTTCEFCAVDKDVIIVSPTGEAISLQTVREIIELLAEEMAACFPEAFSALANIYADSRLNRTYFLQRIVMRFIKCNYSPCDNKPDFYNGTFANIEYVSCPMRGECKLEGIVCNPKYKPSLRPAEMRVMAKWYEGLNENEIADLLCLSVFTVHNHIRNAYARLGVHSRSEFVKYAVQHNLFS